MATTGKRLALVTGATSGIGAAITRRLVASGCRVIMAGRRQERLDALADALGPAVHPLAIDVRAAEAVERAIAALPVSWAEIDLLVNNAGLAVGGQPAQSSSLADWRTIVDTNIVGLLNVTHAILPKMLERDFGDIVNIGSIAGNWPYPTGNVYGASKSFVRQFTLNLRADLLGRNIRAICIEPGTTETEFARVRTGSEEAAKQFYDQPNLLKPEDIAEIVAFCTALPRRVNVNTLEVMPISQGFGPIPVSAGMGPVSDD